MGLNAAWLSAVLVVYIGTTAYTTFLWHAGELRSLQQPGQKNSWAFLNWAVVFCLAVIAACKGGDEWFVHAYECLHVLYALTWVAGYLWHRDDRWDSYIFRFSIFAQFFLEFVAAAVFFVWVAALPIVPAWAIACTVLHVYVLVYTAVFDGVKYAISVAPGYSNAAIVHAVCAGFHLASSLVMLVYGASSRSMPVAAVSSSFMSYSAWDEFCYSDGPAGYTLTDDCPDDQQVLAMSKIDNALFTVNLVALAVTYSSVSGLVHCFMIFDWLAGVHGTPASARHGLTAAFKRESIARFCFDYAISAPVMLVAMNLVFGANGLMAAVFAPILLSVLLASSPAVLLSSQPACFRWLMFAVLVCLYGVCLLPTLGAVAQSGAPVVVQLILIWMVALFSVFTVPFGRELYLLTTDKHRVPASPFYTWAFLSLNAKASLHSFLAVSIFQHGQVTDNSNVVANDLPPSDASFPNVTTAALIIGLVPLAGVLLFCLLRFYFKLNVAIHLYN